MTEKELMLAGKMYDPGDPELKQDRQKAKALCYRFNHCHPDEKKQKVEILSELFQTDKKPHIEPNFFCDYGYNIQFGDNFYANHNCIILDVNIVRFGNNVMLGPNVQIYTATHPLNVTERYSGRELGFAVTVGHNVWIGGGAIIMPGIKIGNNSVIAAGAIVTKDVAEDVVVGGSPAKVIKKIE